MEQIKQLVPKEPIWLDHDRLRALYDERGEVGAEDLVCRAMEEVAARLSLAERHYRAGDATETARIVRSLIAISEQVGMDKVARVAGDVCACIHFGDHIGAAATLSRLVRVGERSLNAIWEADQFCP